MTRRDVVVVGGGIVGLGVAWRAARRGMSVTVLDDAPGRGASHVAAGMIAPVTEVAYGEEPLLALTVDSARRWPAFAAELEEAAGADIGYQRHGTLAVGLDRDDNRLLEDLFRFQRELGLEVERLRARECRRLEPALSPRVRGGILVAGDHQVDNRAATAALLTAAERSGVEIRRRRAERLVVDGHRARGVAVGAEAGGDVEAGAGAGGDGDVVEADTVVLAAGAWSPRLPGLPPEVELPVRPVKGQILRLREPGGRPVLSRTVRGVVEGASVYLVPRAGGRLVVGATVEEQGYDTTVTAGGVRDLLQDAFGLVPETTELVIEEALAGLRPATPDNLPVVGPTALDGLVAATGHYRHGFLLLPATADGVVDLLTSGEVPATLAPCSPLRFSTDRAAV